MSPKAIVTSQYDHKHNCTCEECADARFKARNPHLYGADDDPLGPARGVINACICMIVIIACLVGAILIWTQTADARPAQSTTPRVGRALAGTVTGQRPDGCAREQCLHPSKSPEPIAAPQSLLKAREACPNNASILECRAALRRAYAGIEWQQSENLKLAREMVGKLDDWTCIHSKEGAWNDTADPYWGGLQMDRGFMRLYGADMIRKHHGWANTWTPREQIIVAQRAFVQGRGYAPWPATSHACGLR